MKYCAVSVIVYFCLSCFAISAMAQTETKVKFQEIELKQFYDTKGYIVPASNPWKLWDSSYKLITPVKEQIIQAEEILYQLIEMISGYNENFTNRINKNMRKGYRQYLGAINQKGEELIMIGMPVLHFREKKDTITYMAMLSRGVIMREQGARIDSSRCDEQGRVFLQEAGWTPFYIINLRKHELEKHSDSILYIDKFLNNEY
ncbi:MAG: hypothetical protein LWX56_03625 [Ignavibacteria bacterium]|nr:hypothetical protein [Ignavibacteria bacterium]